MHWRPAWFKATGATTWPSTMSDLFAVGKNLKASGRPLGQALDHTLGDPPGWFYPLLWAYGGQEVDASGQVTINSTATIAAVKLMREAWKDAFDETGLTWDDSSSSRSFLAGNVAAILSRTSTWWSARRGNSPFVDDIAIDRPASRAERTVTVGASQ